MRRREDRKKEEEEGEEEKKMGERGRKCERIGRRKER
jgi:hypothetical protein